MKTLLHPLFAAVLLLYSYQSSIAQTVFTKQDNPTKLQANYVLEQAKTFLPNCGFSSAYIHASDLKELMNVKNCVGIRFYVAMADPKQRFADVIAVAVKDNGQEIGDFLERKYHLAKPLDAHFPDEFEKLNLSSAKKYVFNLRDGVLGIKPYAVFLGLESISNLLKTENATGIRIYSSGYNVDGTELRTMSFGAVKYEGKVVSDAGGDYLQSALPCPVDCGGDPYILWNR
ncbi:MAG: hypothetical protein K9G41_09275 [Flavobacteriales bacterium]|nr:hypothetical protein [Flavobacteriales bacterium]